jgi:hypothetical protein
MSSQVEAAKIEAELKHLESALENVADSRIREFIEGQIEELRARLRQLKTIRRTA